MKSKAGLLSTTEKINVYSIHGKSKIYHRVDFIKAAGNSDPFNIIFYKTLCGKNLFMDTKLTSRRPHIKLCKNCARIG